MESNTLKLFYIKCKGLKHSIGCGETVYSKAFVVAKTMNDAYEKVRKYLDEAGIGFDSDRELESIELLAEQSYNPECGIILYI